MGKRHRRIRAHSTTGQVAGAATEKSGSKPIAQETACPACVPQTSPCPGQPNLRRPTDSSPQTDIFMPQKGAVSRVRIEAPASDESRKRVEAGVLMHPT